MGRSVFDKHFFAAILTIHVVVGAFLLSQVRLQVKFGETGHFTMHLAPKRTIEFDIRTIFREMLNVLLVSHRIVWVLLVAVLATLEDQGIQLVLDWAREASVAEGFAAEGTLDGWQVVDRAKATILLISEGIHIHH